MNSVTWTTAVLEALQRYSARHHTRIITRQNLIREEMKTIEQTVATRGKTPESFPYNSYAGHFVLGVIYSKAQGEIDERRRYGLEELENITSVISNFEFFVQEKFRIAMDRPGSGNTKNIGSVTEISKLINGAGPFSELGLEVFDDYWKFYLTSDMARAAELPNRPYTNLASYLNYKGRRGRKKR